MVKVYKSINETGYDKLEHVSRLDLDQLAGPVEFDDATGFNVVEGGHLVVVRNAIKDVTVENMVAMFAPGEWAYVVVENG